MPLGRRRGRSVEKAAIRQAGIGKRATCHTFRHSFSTPRLEDVSYAEKSALFEFLYGTIKILFDRKI